MIVQSFKNSQQMRKRVGEKKIREKERERGNI